MDNWSVRKTLGFESEEQYDRYKQAGKKRGLTTAQFFSWIADHVLTEDGDNVEITKGLVQDDEQEARICLVFTSEQRDKIKKLARTRGLSMSKFLLMTVEQSERKVNKIAASSSRNAELAALYMLEYHIEFKDQEGVKEQLAVLKNLIISPSLEEKDGFNGDN